MAVSGFQRWADLTPAAIACSDDAAELTYRELDTRSDNIAAALRAIGAGRGTIVALMLPRSVAFVTAALGILKCGAAYLPLDAQTPLSRLRHMVSQCGVPALICDTATGAAAAAAAGNATLINLDTDAVRLARTGRPGICDNLRPDDACYVIYTSGTTGTPKGVIVEHRNLDHLIQNHVALFGISPSSRVTALSSFAFDASVMELWPSLSAGATIHIGPELRTTPVPALARYLLLTGITHSFIPTMLANSLARRLAGGSGDLRVLLTGGDRLFSADHTRDYRLVNLYGPTEATVYATKCEVPDGGTGPVPLGLAVPGVRIHVLDTRGRAVADGQTGEIHIGGAGVARGYLDDADLTGTRFVRDPSGSDGDARLYRTGDLGSWRPDGQLEFRGRVDRQVKIRGYRVELEEVEAVLMSVPEVKQAVVLARGGGDGEVLELVGYVVPGAAECSAAVIRRRAAERLPEYMVPAAIRLIEDIPVTIAGKRDIPALLRLQARIPRT